MAILALMAVLHGLPNLGVRARPRAALNEARQLRLASQLELARQRAVVTGNPSPPAGSISRAAAYRLEWLASRGGAGASAASGRRAPLRRATARRPLPLAAPPPPRAAEFEPVPGNLRGLRTTSNPSCSSSRVIDTPRGMDRELATPSIGFDRDGTGAYTEIVIDERRRPRASRSKYCRSSRRGEDPRCPKRAPRHGAAASRARASQTRLHAASRCWARCWHARRASTPMLAEHRHGTGLQCRRRERAAASRRRCSPTTCLMRDRRTRWPNPATVPPIGDTEEEEDLIVVHGFPSPPSRPCALIDLNTVLPPDPFGRPTLAEGVCSAATATRARCASSRSRCAWLEVEEPEPRDRGAAHDLRLRSSGRGFARRRPGAAGRIQTIPSAWAKATIASESDTKRRRRANNLSVDDRFEILDARDAQ